MAGGVTGPNGGIYMLHSGVSETLTTDATLDVTIKGVLSTDALLATMAASTAVYVKKVVYKEANTVTVTFSGAATSGDKVSVVAYRNK